MSNEISSERTQLLPAAYRDAKVKAESCIGCGYCCQVCPTGALKVNAGEILAAPFIKRRI